MAITSELTITSCGRLGECHFQRKNIINTSAVFLNLSMKVILSENGESGWGTNDKSMGTLMKWGKVATA